MQTAEEFASELEDLCGTDYIGDGDYIAKFDVKAATRLIEADRAAAKLEVLREIDQRRIMIQREPKPEQVGLTRLGAHEAAIDELRAKYADQAGGGR